MNKEFNPKKKGIKRRIASIPCLLVPIVGCLTPIFKMNDNTKIDNRDQGYFAIDLQEPSSSDTTFCSRPSSKTENNIRLMASTLPFIFDGANRGECHEQRKFARAYFMNLEAYYPTNNVGNCGYVAAAMLLGYYSLLWNPFFLPERFRGGYPCRLDSLDDSLFEAPGSIDFPNINFQTLEDKTLDESWNFYFSSIMEQESSIIGYLYSIASETPDPKKGDGRCILDLDNCARPGLYLSQLKLILNKAFARFGISRFVSAEVLTYEDFENGRYDLFNSEYDHLTQGRPLIFGGTLYSGNPNQPNGGGHICIAYDYCEEAGDIYGHKGWKGSNNRHNNFNYEFVSFDDFLYLNISPYLKHVHNRAFEFNGSLYCSCELTSHDHWFTNWFDYGNSLSHARQCSCGEIEYSVHRFIRYGFNQQKCLGCGKIKDQSIGGGIL